MFEQKLLVYFSIIISNLIFFLYYNRFSHYFKIIDYADDKRKIHSDPTPRSGGIFIWISIVNVFFLSQLGEEYSLIELNYINTNIKEIIFFLSSSAIFFVGLYDDRYNISPYKKLIILAIIIFVVLKIDDSLIINSLKFSLFEKSILLEDLGIFFSLLCFLLLMNAFNMFDGINMQLGIYSSILLIFLITNFIAIFFNFALLISFIFFLSLNIKGKIFLGDSGSLLIGYIIGYLLIKSYNVNEVILCDEIFLLLFLPGIDMIRLAIVRLLDNKSMFAPDANHLHHILRRNFGTLLALISIQFTFCITLILLYYGINLLIILTITTFIYILMINSKSILSFFNLLN